MNEPLSAPKARRLIREIADRGRVRFTRHALAEMAGDPLGAIIGPEIESVLRGGVVEEGEFENGSWRYRVRTGQICAVIAFRSRVELVVVTAWRFRR